MTEIKLGSKLYALVQACETYCVAGCCGIDAFDFSPLNIACHLSAYIGRILQNEVGEIEQEIETMLKEASLLGSDDNGFICSIEHMNQFFTVDQLKSFAEELKNNLRLSPQILDLSEKIRYKNEL